MSDCLVNHDEHYCYHLEVHVGCDNICGIQPHEEIGLHLIAVAPPARCRHVPYKGTDVLKTMSQFNKYKRVQ